MASKTWIPGAIAAAALMALLSAPAHAQRASVVVQIAPPAPQVEVVPAVPRGQVWVPGHWRWNGAQHVWVPGRMSARRSGYIFMPAQWVSVNGRWEYREGTWVRPARAPRLRRRRHCGRMDRDKDGDGVRNALVRARTIPTSAVLRSMSRSRRPPRPSPGRCPPRPGLGPATGVERP